METNKQKWKMFVGGFVVIVLLVIVAGGVFFIKKGLDRNEAKNFNDNLVETQQVFIDELAFLNSSLADDLITEEDADEKRAELIDLVGQTINEIENTDTVEEGEDLKQTSLDYMNYYRDLLTGDLLRIIDLYFDNGLTQEKFEELSDLLDKYDSDSTQYADRFEDAQEKFVEYYSL